mgnify:CR=1 FL=1
MFSSRGKKAPLAGQLAEAGSLLQGPIEATAPIHVLAVLAHLLFADALGLAALVLDFFVYYVIVL